MLNLGCSIARGSLQLFQSASVSIPKTCSESIVTPCSLISQRWATKKAGGQANQKGKSKPKHYGPKYGDGEIVFPGMMIMKQPKDVYLPGYNVIRGKDHSILSKTVGSVEYSKYKDENGKILRFINVMPLHDDWSPEYKQLCDVLVEKRADIKREMYGKGFEPAFYFSLAQRNGKMSWLLDAKHNFPGTTTPIA
uniref:Uncharacterized protein n=1 Tax=Polytomella parva TaxID=51329 RepID=A0A7S0UQW3_9CHLO|mmetsp:Transcript_1145/g.1678  ORF Transcript_1145/g.1678 Transcript_1145/m.1678 type:complete len:194 (+) Transcript_1145:46-627(+)